MHIQIHQLKKDYSGQRVLDIPEMEIRPGELFGLVGNNGAGKTTLFRLMLDLIEATDGEIKIGGKNVRKHSLWKKNTGAFLDDSFLVDYLTPEEYFELTGKLHGLPQRIVEERLQAYTGLMGGEILGKKKYLRDFSSGNKQKTGIINALITQPDVLILDEPFNYLDPSSQIRMKEILSDYNRRHNATVVVSSHNLQHIADISTRIVLLERGLVKKDLTGQNEGAMQELEEYFSNQSQEA